MSDTSSALPPGKILTVHVKAADLSFRDKQGLTELFPDYSPVSFQYVNPWTAKSLDEMAMKPGVLAVYHPEPLNPAPILGEDRPPYYVPTPEGLMELKEIIARLEPVSTGATIS